jgi:hypothetical protein
LEYVTLDLFVESIDCGGTEQPAFQEARSLGGNILKAIASPPFELALRCVWIRAALLVVQHAALATRLKGFNLGQGFDRRSAGETFLGRIPKTPVPNQSERIERTGGGDAVTALVANLNGPEQTRIEVKLAKVIVH